MVYIKKYKIDFDFGGAILFLLIMVPNIIWFALPAPDDILRAESMTPGLDAAASCGQIAMVALLCLIKYKDVSGLKMTGLIKVTGASCLLYFAVWVCYYAGINGAVTIVLLCVMPCLAFASYALDRKNYPALVPLGIFTVCHLLYGIINFII